MAVGRYDVASLVEECLQRVGDMQHHVVHPCLAGRSHLRAVHIEFEHVIVRILQVEVLLQLLGSQVHLATDIDVTALALPPAADVVQALGAPGSLLGMPLGSIEILGLPPIALYLAGDHALPTFLISHRSDGAQDILLLGTQETVNLSIHTEHTQQGHLLVGPVTCRTIGQLVVGRPYGEIGVIDYQWHRGQTKVCTGVWFEDAFGLLLLATSHHYCGQKQG